MSRADMTNGSVWIVPAFNLSTIIQSKIQTNKVFTYFSINCTYLSRKSAQKSNRGKDFKVGEKVMAVWQNNKKYPAQITKVIDNGINDLD